MKLVPVLIAIVATISAGAEAQPQSSTLTIMNLDDSAPDPPLSKAELALVNQLSQAQIDQVDRELRANCTHQWRKVAMVVGTTMSTLESRTVGIPAMFYAQRVARLVHEGRLQSQGDLQRMRYSEVRLPTK
jgi:hypothetical protein